MLKTKLSIALVVAALVVSTTGCLKKQEPVQVDEAQVQTQAAPSVETTEEATAEEATTEEATTEEATTEEATTEEATTEEAQ